MHFCYKTATRRPMSWSTGSAALQRTTPIGYWPLRGTTGTKWRPCLKNAGLDWVRWNFQWWGIGARMKIWERCCAEDSCTLCDSTGGKCGSTFAPLASSATAMIGLTLHLVIHRVSHLFSFLSLTNQIMIFFYLSRKDLSFLVFFFFPLFFWSHWSKEYLFTC